MQQNEPYATPRTVTNPDDCYFYHTMDLPGYETQVGAWDLRGQEDIYLGNPDFQGKRVLDMGTASGMLTFHAERCGADVVSYDLSENFSWDVVPLLNADYKKFEVSNKTLIRRSNDAYWLAHGALASKARMVYGTVYDVPKSIGPVDITIFGTILQHIRDPFLALQNALRLTKERVIVTDICPRLTFLRCVLTRLRIPFEALDFYRQPYAVFVPKCRQPLQGVWWLYSPQIITCMLAILGFEDVRVTYHWQRFEHRKWRLYTIHARRTQDHYDY